MDEDYSSLTETQKKRARLLNWNSDAALQIFAQYYRIVTDMLQTDGLGVVAKKILTAFLVSHINVHIQSLYDNSGTFQDDKLMYFPLNLTDFIPGCEGVAPTNYTQIVTVDGPFDTSMELYEIPLSAMVGDIWTASSSLDVTSGFEVTTLSECLFNFRGGMSSLIGVTMAGGLGQFSEGALTQSSTVTFNVEDAVNAMTSTQSSEYSARSMIGRPQ